MVDEPKSRPRRGPTIPGVFDTRAVYEAWLLVLRAQFLSGHISRSRYRARVEEARKKWRYELSCAPERETHGFYGRRPAPEAAEQREVG